MRTKARFFYLIVFIFFLQTILVSVAAAATRIMPLGDSITEGYIDGTIDPEERVGYRKKLYADLIGQGHDVNFVGSLPLNLPADPDFDYDHEGHIGWEASGGTDEGLAANVLDWLMDNPADIVLLHIGTNDITNGESPADIVSQVDLVLDQIFHYDIEIIVILARIINRQTPDQNTTAFNNLLPGMVNLHPNRDNIFIVNQENALDYATDMANNLHPNMSGYYKMADVWFSALEQILPDPDPDPPNNSSSSNSGCFISTATYGLHMEPHSKALVNFRDHFLLTNFVGRAFVDFYHSIRHLRLISRLDVFIK